MNFAHLASFQAIEFVEWPVPKALDISVCQTSENKAFFTKGSFLYRKNKNTSESHLQSPHFPLGAPSTMAALTTWEESSSENSLGN